MIRAESSAYFRALGAHISGDRRVSVLILAKLAKGFGMPVEELMGTTKMPRPPGNRRISPAGLRYAERYQQLSKTEQRFVKKIMDVLLEKYAPRSSAASN
jgi:hypothetical protein